MLDASLIRTNSAAKSGTILTLTIAGYAGHNYQLLRADNLTSPWTGIGGAQAGNGSLLTLSDAGGAVGEQKFYRVMVAP